MDRAMVELAVIVPFLLVAEMLLLGVAWRMNGGELHRPVLAIPQGGLRAKAGAAGALFGAWLLLTAMTVWCGFLTAFVVVHVLLFTLGRMAAWLGIGVAAVALASAPFIWGWIAVKQARAR